MNSREMSSTVFEAFNSGDVETIINNCAADCEMICPGPSSIPYAGTMKGHQEILRFFTLVGQTQSHPKFTIENYVAEDNTVVAIGQYRSAVMATGNPIDVPLIVVLTWKDGKIARHLVLTDNAAVGSAYSGSASAAQTAAGD